MPHHLLKLAARTLLFCALSLFPVVFHVALAEQDAAASAQDGVASTEFETALDWVEQGEFARAAEVFERLAARGDAEAQHNLAMLYRKGAGVPRNFEQSVQWFRRAAEQGVPDAQYMLGYSYDGGEGVRQSTKWAFIWYRKAAEQGHGLAQVNLGVMYANGAGVEQDLEQAYLWFHAAAAQGYSAALENRQIVEEALSPERLATLKTRASEHYKRYVVPFLGKSYRPGNLRGDPQAR